MSVKKGKITLTQEINVIKKMEGAKENSEAAKSFRFLEGYTAGSSGNQLFAMLKSNKTEHENESRLVRISGSGTKISTIKTNLKHANDCTYYNGNYYVVTSRNKEIYAFDQNSLLKTHTYEYRGSYLGDAITCISHISDDFFLLGNGNRVAVCRMYTTIDPSLTGGFVDETNFTLDKDSGTNPATLDTETGLTRQGMFVEYDHLYKVYGKKKNEEINKNYIAKWSLTGPSPSYTGCTLLGLYDQESSNTKRFEMQSISAIPQKAMYTAVQQIAKGSSEYEAKLYKVSF